MKMKKFLVITTIFSLLTMGLALPVSAANLKTISDTLSDSDLGVAATHTISFEASTASISASSTITYTFDVAWGGLDAIDFSGISAESGFAAVETCTAAASEVLVTTSATVLTLEVCNGDTISAGTKSLVITGMSNPVAAGSQLIAITYGTLESGATRVAIIDDVTVSAAVGTSFTFTVASSTVGSVGSDSCNLGTATSLSFGTLVDSVPKVGCQKLTVATNAKNGFVVTVKQDAALVSASGADIDTFKDGAGTATPEAWASPSNTLDTESTYGHMGITSTDSDLNTNEFDSGTKYAGNIVSAARTIFSHTGPANGTTQDKGMVNVAYKVEISALQEAADDYSATLTYVATPTF